jgi:hypothetical protein
MALVYKKNGTLIALADKLSGHETIGGDKATGVRFDWTQVLVDTSLTGNSASDQFTGQFNTVGVTSSIIYWGDGTYEIGTQAPVHTYPSSGQYKVRYTPNQGSLASPIERNGFGADKDDNKKIVDIQRWGQYSENCFRGHAFTLYPGTTWTATDYPDPNKSGPVNNASTHYLSNLFKSSPNLTSIPTTFTCSGVFAACPGMFTGLPSFNGSLDSLTLALRDAPGFLSNCPVFNSSVNNLNFDLTAYTVSGPGLGAFFSGCTVFNQPVNNWNTTSNASLVQTFKNAKAFNQDVSAWDVSSVVSLSETFNGADVFNNGGVGTGAGTGIDLWGSGPNAITSPCSLNYAFAAARDFNQYIGGWTFPITSLSAAFFLATDFNNGDTPGVSGGGVGVGMDNWDVSQCSNFNDCFSSQNAFNQYIGSWTVTKPNTQMRSMFSSNANFNQDIGGWNMSNVTTIANMFASATSFNQNVGGWTLTSLTSLRQVFGGAQAFNNGGSNTINNWNTAGCSDFTNVFSDAHVFNQPVHGWDMNTGGATTCENMFQRAYAFNNGGVGSGVGTGLDTWNVSSIQNMTYMFSEANAFNQYIGSWTTSSVTNMSLMFNPAPAFSQDISGWSIASLQNASGMFIGNSFGTTNYDLLLDSTTGWASQATIQSGVTFSAGSTQYTLGGNAEAGHNYLTGTKMWNITDGGGI